MFELKITSFEVGLGSGSGSFLSSHELNTVVAPSKTTAKLRNSFFIFKIDFYLFLFYYKSLSQK